MSSIKLNTIEEAVADFREGKFVIVVDDEDRENEGDLIIAAEKATPEKINFMLIHARGVLCAPITVSRCEELDLPHQVVNNTSVLGTPFTVTIDKLEGCSTGVSAADHYPCVGRSDLYTGDIRSPRTHQSVVCTGEGCTSSGRTYRSQCRYVPLGWTLSGCCLDGDHERRWYDGSPAPIEGDGGQV